MDDLLTVLCKSNSHTTEHWFASLSGKRKDLLTCGRQTAKFSRSGPSFSSKALRMAATSPVKSPTSPASLPQIPSLAKYKLGNATLIVLHPIHSYYRSSYFNISVFLGDQGVGKTSIITRFMYDTFEKNYQVSFVWVTWHRTCSTLRLGWTVYLVLRCNANSEPGTLLLRQNRQRLESTSCPRQCTWRTAPFVCSCGIQLGKSESQGS